MDDLYFGGSVWCNVDIALRQVNLIYKQEIQALGLSVIEWYLLQMLYEKDGQIASRLADRVGRTASSVIPILNNIQDKGLIERRPHAADRREVCIYVTRKGRAIEPQVNEAAIWIEKRLRTRFKDKDWQRFQGVLLFFQTLS